MTPWPLAPGPTMSLCPPLPFDADEVQESLRPLRHDFSVALFRFGNPFATGAVIRVAHSFLAREIYLLGSEPYYEKASMGMEKFETIEPLQDADELFARVAPRPVWGLEREAATVNINTVESFPPGVVFLFGSERFGLPEAVLKRCDQVAAIPMYGVNQSFPVAVASGIVMNEWCRRHRGRLAGG